MQLILKNINKSRSRPSRSNCENRINSIINQDQRSEAKAESKVRSKSDDVLHAVSIPAYETNPWKEDSCSPNLDENLAQGAIKI